MTNKVIEYNKDKQKKRENKQQRDEKVHAKKSK